MDSRDGEHHGRRRDELVKRNRRLLVDSNREMDHQLVSGLNGQSTTMDINNVEHQKAASAGVDELELERQRETDPFRPIVLVLLEQATQEMAREKEKRRERDLVARPAQRSRVDRP